MENNVKQKVAAAPAAGGLRMTTHLYVLILSCFFVSGLTGLIYQIIWTRMIVKIIGSAPFAVSIVLTVFMGGLGLGSYLAGRYVDQVKKPFRLVQLYGLLELLIGAYSLVLPLLLTAFRPLYAFLYNRFFEYFIGYSLLTFVGCTVLLILPVICMGATLPVLSRFFVTQLDKVGTHVGRLYGLNTIGAAAGSLLCGFWLINYLGVWGATVFAISLNMMIGAICLLTAGRLIPHALGTPDHDNRTQTDMPASVPDTVWEEVTAFPAGAALLVFAVSGFCAMAYEVIWVKLLGIIVGPTTYSFTIVLVTFITGLAIGSIFFGWLADRIGRTADLLLFSQIAAALFALCFSQVMGNSQIFFAKLIQYYKGDFSQLMLAKSAVLFVFMFFPTFCLGATFPLVGKICTRTLARTGRSIGFAYAVNTVGAVLGSFCAGFILIPFMGKELGLSLVISLQLFSAIVIGLYLTRKVPGFGTRKKEIVLAAIGLMGILCLYQYPHWDRKMLARGKYHRFEQFKKHSLGWMDALFSGTRIYAEDENYDLVYYGDGIGGFTTVIQTRPNALGVSDYALLNSGKADASSAKSDMYTQVLLAHFPMLLHPKPENVLVLGLASGITSGELLHYPVKRIDTIEINRQVVAASNFFIPWNNNVLQSPESELIIQDGRAHLELTDRYYDVIISEPSNPWMAGLANLFTREFMTLAKNRLAPGGVFVQWLHSYQMDWKTFALIGRTFKDVFPNSFLATTDPRGDLGPDFLMIGINGSTDFPDMSVAQRNFQYARKSANMVFRDPGILYQLIVSEDLSALFGNGRINTDNRPWLEYSAPKLLYVGPGENEISKKIRQRYVLSPYIIDSVKQNMADVDFQLDYAAFALSFTRHDSHIADLDHATTDQRARYRKMMMDYSANTVIHDFSFIPDPGLRKTCLELNLEAIEKVAQRLENRAPSYFYMGWLCHRNGFGAKAASYLLQVLQYEPESGKVHELLKKIFKQLPESDIDKIMEQLYARARSFPENQAFFYYLGSLSAHRGDFEKAGAFFKKALAIDADFVLALNSMAELMIQFREYDEAIQYYRKLLAIRPDYATVYYNIACLYGRQQKPEMSVEWLRQAVEKGYDNWSLIQSDKDLEAARSTEGFRTLLRRHAG